MSNKIKIIIIVIIAVIIVAGAAIFWLTRSSSPTANSLSSGSAGSEVSAPTSGPPSGLKIPEGDTIQLGTSHGTVTVNNFYKNIVGSEDEFLILQQNSDYEITYDTDRNAFYIQISSAMPTARSAGEQAFLTLLGINQSDACRLNVAESDAATLSFCSGGAFQSK